MTKLLLGILYIALGNIFAWFQFNSQFIWKWWEDKPFSAVFLFAIPTGLCFWFGTKNIVSETGTLWSSKLIAFGVSTLIFSVLTYFIARESAFTMKTMASVFLAMLIIFIQIYWK